jgi:hypothetical protein
MNLQQGYLQVYQKTGRKYHTLQTTLSKPNERIGNLEHLHLYCKSSTLVNTRIYCYHKIERANHNLYDFASIRETGISFHQNTRMTTLQENLQSAALEQEKQERTILINSQLSIDARKDNKAILSRNTLRPLVLLNKLPADK